MADWLGYSTVDKIPVERKEPAESEVDCSVGIAAFWTMWRDWLARKLIKPEKIPPLLSVIRCGSSVVILSVVRWWINIRCGFSVADLKNKLDKSEKQRSSDMVAFRKTSSNFRHVIRDLLGWTVRLDSNKVTFHVADAPPDEMIIFEREDENKPWNLKATDYTAANEVFVSEFLRSHHSPPGFFARIILKILSERTLICLDSATP